MYLRQVTSRLYAPIGEQKMKTRDEIILSMCYSYTHDYGLLPDNEKHAIWKQMEQIFTNDIEPHIILKEDKQDLTDYQKECLTILMEECSEAVQEICKIFRFGLHATSHHSPDKNHIACLIQELGDIIAMIELVVESDIGITDEKLYIAKSMKREKVKKWMKHKKPQGANNGQ